MLAVLSNIKAALLRAVGVIIASTLYAIAYTLIAIHIFYCMFYGFLADLYSIADEPQGPPMFALTLYYILDYLSERVHKYRICLDGENETSFKWQAAEVLLLVWAIPNSVAAVLGDDLDFKVVFDTRLLEYVLDFIHQICHILFLQSCDVG